MCCSVVGEGTRQLVGSGEFSAKVILVQFGHKELTMEHQITGFADMDLPLQKNMMVPVEKSVALASLDLIRLSKANCCGALASAGGRICGMVGNGCLADMPLAHRACAACA